MGVLHTHSRRLDFHPHVHMVMPAAALDTRRGLWRTKCRRSKAQAHTGNARPGGGYLFSHKALAKVFRAKVLDAVEAAGLALPEKLPGTWVVDCRCVGDGSQALLYLGRYLYRGVVQESGEIALEGWLYDGVPIDATRRLRWSTPSGTRRSRRATGRPDLLKVEPF